MTSSHALIGHTGFVGSNLVATGRYNALFNSTTIHDIRRQSFRRIVCAGVSAKKWLANKEPEADRAGIATLTDALAQVEAEEFVLISTVDIFATPAGASEATHPEKAGLHPYGLHRLELEEFIRAKFPRTLILRLPALFGPGLRKNVLFDLLHDNMLNAINPAAAFQWYPTTRLQADIDRALQASLDLVHLVTEPLPTSRILSECFADKTVGSTAPAALYDLHTRHAAAFGGMGHYILDREAVLAEIKHYVQTERTA